MYQGIPGQRMRLALLGSRHGPWVSIRGMRIPALKVCGLEADAVLRVRVDETEFIITENGRHSMPPGEWAICEVIRGSHTRVYCHFIAARAA